MSEQNEVVKDPVQEEFEKVYATADKNFLEQMLKMNDILREKLKKDYEKKRRELEEEYQVKSNRDDSEKRAIEAMLSKLG